MQFPYGIADFYAAITEDYFYVDRTDRIALIEQAGKQLLLLRPRRFGKSLWLSTLENYYDVAKADEFAKLFGHLKIGQNPTPRHNRYFILKWNFSLVDPRGDTEAIHLGLYQHINSQIQAVALKYQHWLPVPVMIEDNAMSSLQALLSAIALTPYKLYLLIDEYDNFANEVLVSQQQGLNRYQELVGGEGAIKTVLKAVKAAAEGQGLDRVFMTGVSPVVLADITSGYNVVKNISLYPEYRDLCGFHEAEVRETLEVIVTQCQWPVAKAVEALDLMRAFYNGYNFSCEPEQGLIYNPTLALYFFEHLNQRCRYPQQMLDSNLAMDRSRIQYVGNLPYGRRLLEEALNSQQPVTIPQLSDRFGVEMMLMTPKDHGFLASLLYYFGVLTYFGHDDMGNLQLVVPNLVVRKLYVERMQEMLLPGYELTEQRLAAAQRFYGWGELEPLCDFIEHSYYPALDNRDLRWTNELVIKTAFLMVLFNDLVYITDSETAIAKGYADLSLIIRPDRRQYKLLDHVLEFKYLSLSELGLSSEQAAAMAREELVKLPKVQAKLQAAESQLAGYRRILEPVYGDKLRLRTHAIVGLGLTRLVWVN